MYSDSIKRVIADICHGRRRSVLPVLERHGQLQEQLAPGQFRLSQPNHTSPICSGISEISEDHFDEPGYDNPVLSGRLRKGTARDTRQS